MAAAPSLTVGVIARRLNEPLHRINYVLRTRGIKPAGIAGAYRVFTEEQVAQIVAELAEIEAREAGRRQAVTR
jgi:hypothetical protein